MDGSTYKFKEPGTYEFQIVEYPVKRVSLVVTRILLTEVSVSPGGRFTAYYNDDDMFWGHSVEVSGSLKKGITYANLAG